MMGWEAILERFPSAYMVEVEDKDDEVMAVVESCEVGLPCVITRCGVVLRLVCFTNEMRKEIFKG